MRIFHAADIHLDSPMRGLARYEGAPVERLRASTRQAFKNLVDACIAERARALILAGDLYDGDWRDYATGLFFSSQMAKLHDANVAVIFGRGNHDAASQITKHLRLPPNVTDLATDAPQTVVLEDAGLAFHGQGFPTRAVTADIAQTYPPAVGGLFNVGVLHTALSGYEGHELYAPTTLGVLRGRGYDYWALGHIHHRHVVSDDPPIVFPGNLQGRHRKERGDKGATLLTVEGVVLERMEHRAMDVARWGRIRVEASEGGLDELLGRARASLQRALEEADGRLLCARVELTAKGDLSRRAAARERALLEDLRAIAFEVGADDLWIESMDLRTVRPTETIRETDDDARRALLRAFETAATDPERRERLREVVEPLLSQLPPQVFEIEPDLRLDDDGIAKLLERAERLAFAKLSGDDA